MIIIGAIIQVFVQIAGGSGGSEFHIVAINPVELGIAIRSTPTEVSGAFAHQAQNQVFRREEIGHHVYDHAHRVRRHRQSCIITGNQVIAVTAIWKSGI
ncbi:hypothetical protein DSECCO2_484120 [anaerobic digester metagenome]